MATTATYFTGEHSLGESFRNSLIVTRREVRDSFRDWRIMVPIFVLTLVFPFLANNMTGLFIHFFEVNGASPLVDNFLPLLPMIVGFFPISISLVIALETFVGEKERRSLEPLLSTPLTNSELYVGKALAAMIPPLLASYTGIAIYVGSLVFGSTQWRPELELIIQIVVLTTAQALIMVTGAVVVSSQTTSTRAANLLASFIIIPISLLVMFESYVMITNNRYLLWYVVIGLIVADVMLFGMGARLFNREELLGSSIDEINIKWAWRVFWTQFRGGPEVKNLVDWYRLSVLPTLPRLRQAIIVTCLSIVITFVAGFVIARVRSDLVLLPAGSSHDQTLKNFNTYFALANNPQSILAILNQNGRILVGGALLSIFTFGVISIIFTIAPFGILGYLIAQPGISSLGVGTFIAAVVPHSLFEVPAIVIATAAAVRLGAIITRPPQGDGVWDSWLRALADAIKIGFAVVLPLLIVAALIEVYITPRIVQMVLGG